MGVTSSEALFTAVPSHIRMRLGQPSSHAWEDWVQLWHFLTPYPDDARAYFS
jgi:hypothetical protein